MDEQQSLAARAALLARIKEQVALAARLHAIEQRLATLNQRLDQRAASDGHEPDAAPLAGELAALREAVAALEKQIGRAGREQFKASARAETQAAQLADALDTLRAANERNAAALETLRAHSQAAHSEARLDVARAMLPALDGLDEALRSGAVILAGGAAVQESGVRSQESGVRSQESGVRSQRSEVRGQESAGEATHGVDNRRRGWLRGLFAAPPAPLPPPAPAPRAAPDDALRPALEAWLHGLTFVRRRLLDALAAEGVTPIEAVGQPFDPRLHVAIEVAPAAGLPPGTVAHETRRGYRVGERLLRPAEVAVTPERPAGDITAINHEEHED